MTFNVDAETSEGIQSLWTTKSKEGAITCAIPPEFEGPGGGQSPEELFSLALLNCFFATFKVFAEKSKLAYRSLRASGILTVDKNEQGQPCMKHFSIKVTLEADADRERCMRILEKTSKSCMILNSVVTTKEFTFSIV